MAPAGLLARAHDGLRQRVIGAVRERIAVDHQQRPALVRRFLLGLGAGALARAACRLGCFAWSRLCGTASLRRCVRRHRAAPPRPAHGRWRSACRARRGRRRRRPAGRQVWRQQDLIEPQPGVALPALSHVVPERIHRRIRMQRADGIDPALRQQALVGGAALRLQQRVLVVGFGRIDVLVGRHDVVVAREHDRDAGLVKRGGMADQPLDPGELVVEFRSGLRVAVRRVERGDQHAVDRGLDVAALRVVRIARQLGARHDRLAPRARIATPFQVFWPRQTAS